MGLWGIVHSFRHKERNRALAVSDEPADGQGEQKHGKVFDICLCRDGPVCICRVILSATVL